MHIPDPPEPTRTELGPKKGRRNWESIAKIVGAGIVAAMGAYGSIEGNSSANANVVREITKERIEIEDQIDAAISKLSDENKQLRSELDTIRRELSETRSQIVDVVFDLARGGGRNIPRGKVATQQEKKVPLVKKLEELAPPPPPPSVSDEPESSAPPIHQAVMQNLSDVMKTRKAGKLISDL